MPIWFERLYPILWAIIAAAVFRFGFTSQWYVLIPIILIYFNYWMYERFMLKPHTKFYRLLKYLGRLSNIRNYAIESVFAGVLAIVFYQTSWGFSTFVYLLLATYRLFCITKRYLL